MEDDGVESHAVEKAETKSKLLEVVKDCTTDFDDSKFCGLRRVRAGREDAKVTLDFTFRTKRVEQAGDCILHICQHTSDCVVERTDSVGLDNRLDGPNGVSAPYGGERSLAATGDDRSFRSHGQTRR
jgi:hypothetical protein